MIPGSVPQELQEEICLLTLETHIDDEYNKYFPENLAKAEAEAEADDLQDTEILNAILEAQQKTAKTAKGIRAKQQQEIKDGLRMTRKTFKLLQALKIATTENPNYLLWALKKVSQAMNQKITACTEALEGHAAWNDKMESQYGVQAMPQGPNTSTGVFATVDQKEQQRTENTAALDVLEWLQYTVMRFYEHLFNEIQDWDQEFGEDFSNSAALLKEPQRKHVFAQLCLDAN